MKALKNCLLVVEGIQSKTYATKNPEQRQHVGKILNVPCSCFIRYLSNSFQGKVCNTSACCALWPISNYSSHPSTMEREKRQYVVKSEVLVASFVNSVSLLDAKCSRIKKANVLFSRLISSTILSWTIDSSFCIMIFIYQRLVNEMQNILPFKYLI